MKNNLSFLCFAFILIFPASLKLSAQTLSDAVTKGDTVLALQLIKSGADPNKPDETGSTPLLAACRWGNIPMVKLLLANGANADQPRSGKGRTPLIVACAYYSGITVVKLLIGKGADVNATSNDGSTPLMLAANNAKLDVVEYLLAKGADARKKDLTGLMALDYAQKADPGVFGTAGIKDCQLDKGAVITRLIPLSH